MSMFESTISALTEVIVRERCGAVGSGNSSALDAVAHFLLRSHASMPDYLRLPLKSLTLLFGLWTLPTTGRLFHRLPPEHRLQAVHAWKNSMLGPRRELIKFYETLAVFGWYSERYGQDYASPVDAQPHAER